MKLLLFGATLVFFVFCTFASEADEDLQSYFAEESRLFNPFVLGQKKELESRSEKKCIKRYHICTNDRHGCCRGELFKDECMCFVTEKSKARSAGAEDLCSCQEPPQYKLVDKAVQAATHIGRR